MGTSGPDWNGLLASVFGPAVEGIDPSFSPFIALASNVITGQNPPYTVQDFFTMFPKFAGQPLLSGLSAPLASFISGSANATVNNSAGMAAGQPIAGVAIPDNTFIASISGTTVVMTNPATQTIANVPIIVWNATTVPVVVLQVYINLASAALIQARWQDTWVLAMGLFVAHFATLYAKSDGNPNSNVGQIAAQGLSSGIQISKSAGDVQVSYTPVQGIEHWGAWNLTTYGQQLATFAKIIGMGPMLLY